MADSAPGARTRPRPPVDLDALRAAVTDTVRAVGLAAAWEAHAAEILQAAQQAHEGERAELDLRAVLHQWVQADDELRPLLERPAARAELDAFLRGADRAIPLAPRDLVILDELPEILEADGQPMRGVRRRPFQNWGRTVRNVPALTLLPRTRAGVCNLVRWARDHGKRVRVAGYRHSWADVFSADDEVLVSLVPLPQAEELPHHAAPPDPTSDLHGVTLVDTITVGGAAQALVRVGAATSNEALRRFCLSPAGGAARWALPLNVIMVEITLGGSTSALCHGAGWRNQTLSDLVAAVEFVNPNGELQVISDRELLRSAGGCLGLLGVVTAVTLRLDRMSYARMVPRKPRLALTVPPPPGEPVPRQVDMSGLTAQQLDAAWAEFVRSCEQDHYAEWFWFPYHDRGWINTWHNDGDPAQAEAYPTPAQTAIQEAMTYLAGLINDNWLFQRLPGRTQARIFSASAMAALPERGEDDPIVTTMSDALHFRRGIQNLRCRDMELELPVPPRADDPSRPDWSLCQRAFWAAVRRIYARPDAPVRVALEMRVMGGSSATLAPQRGNLATCSIEVLSSLNVPDEDWRSFIQELADDWSALTDSAGGRLRARPHWAKEWQTLTFDGEPAARYLKRVYAGPMAELRGHLQAIAEAGGFALGDLRRRFSNPLLDDLFASVFAEA